MYLPRMATTTTQGRESFRSPVPVFERVKSQRNRKRNRKRERERERGRAYECERKKMRIAGGFF